MAMRDCEGGVEGGEEKEKEHKKGKTIQIW